MALILSTPLRAAWTDPAGAATPSYRRLLPVVASATLTTVLVAFSFDPTWPEIVGGRPYDG